MKHFGMRDRRRNVITNQARIERVVLCGRVIKHTLIERCVLVPQKTHRLPPSRARRDFRRRQGVDVLDDQGSGAFVGEHFAKNALAALIGDDVDAAHAAANGVLRWPAPLAACRQGASRPRAGAAGRANRCRR